MEVARIEKMDKQNTTTLPRNTETQTASLVEKRVYLLFVYIRHSGMTQVTGTQPPHELRGGTIPSALRQGQLAGGLILWQRQDLDKRQSMNGPFMRL